MVKVLITSVGKRVRLVENFLEVAEVYGCDANPKLSPAAYFVKECFEVPYINTQEYIPTLLEIVKKNNIDIIVPTIDTELTLLAKNKELFEKLGAKVMVSSVRVCEIFYLKTSTEEFFSSRGFQTPKIINNLEEASFPLFAKLDNSSLSVGAMKVNNFSEAKKLQQANKNYIFQEFIEGDEFTVDCFVAQNKESISIVPRRRLEIRAGEVSKARTSKNQHIINEVKKLLQSIDGFYGAITVQLFYTKEKNIYFIEVNPRFGGGYPLSWLSGANFAQYVVDDFLGKKLHYMQDWQDGKTMLRYDAEVVF